MAMNVVTPGNLGNEFDIGVEEPSKIHVKLDGSLTRLADGSLSVVAAPAQFYLCQIWAEENGGLNTNHREWSFGNGNTLGTGAGGNWGVVLPYPGSVIALSLGARIGGGGVTDVALQLNQTTVDTITMSGSKAWKTGMTVPFVAGDVLNFRTVAPGGANDCVMSALVRYEVA